MKTLLALLILAGTLSQTEAAAPAAALWPADGLTKVLRTDRPGANPPARLVLGGARGETVSGQAVFKSRQPVAEARAKLTDFRHQQSGATIPAGAAVLQWVRYIDIRRNTTGIPKDELVALAPTALPDPYWEDRAVSVKADQAQPLWLEIAIPQDAQAGEYEAKLVVQFAGEEIELPVTLQVWNFDLPSERHLSVINWWRFPGMGFEKNIAPHSPEYYALLGQFCRFLAAHRQTDVNAALADLVVLRSGSGEAGANDTTRLERFAEAAFAAGIQRIHLHSLGQHTAGLTDPASRVRANENNFRRLPAVEEVSRRRGWQGRFLASIADEPFIHHEETFAALVDRAHAAAPSVRCIEAVETENLGKLDIYVPKLSHLNLWYPRFDQARREGAQLWFYTCCHPTGRYPNRFLDQSLVKVRVLHWINYLYNLDGYLHWGLNHFYGDNPFTEEGISQDLPLGDRAMAYPGKTNLVGSLRFSAQRDGLQDFEYLWLLEHQLARVKQQIGPEAASLDPRQRPLELCRRVVWSFHDYTREAARLLETRGAIAREIEALQSVPLLVIQTSPPEGTVVPAGPRVVLVRGWSTPGAKVTLNGQPVTNVRPSGYFYATHFLPDGQPVVRITSEHQGRQQTAERAFLLAD
jgi:hypothetical protein